MAPTTLRKKLEQGIRRAVWALDQPVPTIEVVKNGVKGRQLVDGAVHMANATFALKATLEFALENTPAEVLDKEIEENN